MKRAALVVSFGVLPVFAQADCGWLLMEPPRTGNALKGDLRFVPEAPLHDWGQHSAHDSAEACERRKQQVSAEMLTHARTAEDALRGNLVVFAISAGWAYRCLPASRVPIR